MYLDNADKTTIEATMLTLPYLENVAIFIGWKFFEKFNKNFRKIQWAKK